MQVYSTPENIQKHYVARSVSQQTNPTSPLSSLAALALLAREQNADHWNTDNTASRSRGVHDAGADSIDPLPEAAGERQATAPVACSLAAGPLQQPHSPITLGERLVLSPPPPYSSAPPIMLRNASCKARVLSDSDVRRPLPTSSPAHRLPIFRSPFNCAARSANALLCVSADIAVAPTLSYSLSCADAFARLFSSCIATLLKAKRRPRYGIFVCVCVCMCMCVCVFVCVFVCARDVWRVVCVLLRSRRAAPTCCLCALASGARVSALTNVGCCSRPAAGKHALCSFFFFFTARTLNDTNSRTFCRSR